MGMQGKLPFNPLPFNARPHDYSGDNLLDIYNAESTQRYVAGTRFLRWDGSVFKYSRLKGSSSTGKLIWNTSGLVNTAVTGATIAAGDRTMTFTLGADDGYGGGGYAEDELVGGIVGLGGVAGRMITGNTAAAVSTAMTITIDGAWQAAYTTPFTEISYNPYFYLSNAVNAHGAAMGMPHIASTTDNFIWIQSYGPCVCTGSGSAGNADYQRSVYVAPDGAVRDGSEVTIETGGQLVGYILDEGDGANGCMPVVMLQLSI